MTPGKFSYHNLEKTLFILRLKKVQRETTALMTASSKKDKDENDRLLKLLLWNT